MLYFEALIYFMIHGCVRFGIVRAIQLIKCVCILENNVAHQEEMLNLNQFRIKSRNDALVFFPYEM